MAFGTLTVMHLDLLRKRLALLGTDSLLFYFNISFVIFLILDSDDAIPVLVDVP